MTPRQLPNPFDFATDDPQRLLAEYQPEDLYHNVKALERWDPRALDVVESTLAYWTSNAVSRPRDREGIGEIRSLIRRLQAIQPLERQQPDLDVAARYQHWNGMVAVLESRAHLIDYHDPEEIQNRARMPELRLTLQDDAAANGMCTQDLLKKLDVSAPRLSQLLALAEAAGLVERKKKGREQWVRAAGIWRRSDDTTPPLKTAIAANGDTGMHVPGRAKLAA